LVYRLPDLLIASCGSQCSGPVHRWLPQLSWRCRCDPEW